MTQIVTVVDSTDTWVTDVATGVRTRIPTPFGFADAQYGEDTVGRYHAAGSYVITDVYAPETSIPTIYTTPALTAAVATGAPYSDIFLYSENGVVAVADATGARWYSAITGELLSTAPITLPIVAGVTGTKIYSDGAGGLLIVLEVYNPDPSISANYLTHLRRDTVVARPSAITLSAATRKVGNIHSPTYTEGKYWILGDVGDGYGVYSVTAIGSDPILERSIASTPSGVTWVKCLIQRNYTYVTVAPGTFYKGGALLFECPADMVVFGATNDHIIYGVPAYSNPISDYYIFDVADRSVKTLPAGGFFATVYDIVSDGFWNITPVYTEA
jgi:hypothetical protein